MRLPLLSLLLALFASQCLADITITTTSLPRGTVSKAYSAVINASDGCTPYSWAITAGTLPPGISRKLSATTTSLDLYGTPTIAATYSFTVSAEGCGGHVSQVSYNIVIQPTANHVVDLNWKASTTSAIVGYNVYRGPDGATWKRINASLVGSTLYSDSTVANSTTYYYATTAVDIDGHESNMSAAIKAAIP